LRYTEKKLLSPSDQNSHTKIALATSFHVNYLEQKFCWDGNNGSLFQSISAHFSGRGEELLGHYATLGFQGIMPRQNGLPLYVKASPGFSLCNFRSFTCPKKHQPQAQISNHRRACTQAHLLHFSLHKLVVLARSSLIVRKEQ
jgi:hypothetical protein